MEYEWPEGVIVSEDARDFIERLLKINPTERLGAGKAGTPNDFSQLMRHPYFEGISFSDLTTIPIPLSVNSSHDFEIVDHLIPCKGNDNIIREGILLKRNKLHVKQERFFVLYMNGELHYYSNENYCGTIRLTKQS